MLVTDRNTQNFSLQKLIAKEQRGMNRQAASGKRGNEKGEHDRHHENF